MSEQQRIADQQARSRALDPCTSFIVQAPAGSGKTGLLTQRFLVLLAGVEVPEEVVAITFTRKAAAEMRQRLLQALEQAQSNRPPEQDHERHTWALARRVLARDQEQGWQLLDHPARLCIQTIDSLCTALARQMPVLSQFGAVPAIAEDARPLYLEAARNTLDGLECKAEWSDAVAHLVRHLDGRLDKLQGLISAMLARRDQWLRHIMDPELKRNNLEEAMACLVAEALRELANLVPGACVPELLELLRFAAANLQGKDSPIAACVDLEDLPGVQVTDRPQWEGLAALLLTGKGSWRKQVTKNVGFPASSSTKNPEEKDRFTQLKQRMVTLLGILQDDEAFREQLALLRELPPTQYTDGEWEILQALVTVLRLAAAHLELVFSQTGQVDFPALLQAAIRALGEPEAPTDLALALDYRIHHLLVDEFQDTSFNQLTLLKGLTTGWQPGDGRTLFVVGDPMQSIYRFREAEVGLFLAAGAHGIGQVPLEPLQLSVNFRSQQGIIDWINQNFPQVLPAKDHIADGAVSYAPAIAIHPPQAGNAVTVYPSLQRDDRAEAQQVVSIVQQARTAHPDGTTAILVRGRAHLVQIVQRLRKARIRFQAVEIERLAQRPVVQDLLALTRALCHVGDRIAWLAVLRAPYCGLTIEDLYALAGNDTGQTIIDLLHQQPRIAQLSEDGRNRITRVLPVLDTALSEQARCPLHSYVEGVWIALGGPACVTNETDLQDADVYLQLLEKLGNEGDMPDIHELTRQVEQLFALPDVKADESLQIMTIHKAKGLEFDTVIVPGLGRSPRHAEDKLLHWLVRSCETGTRPAEARDLLLAPISAQGEDKNPMSAYLQRLDKTKGYFEGSRLLYVAATRARLRLYLLGHVGVQEQDDGLKLKTPPGDTLLAKLWPVVKSHFQSHLTEHGIETAPHAEGPESTVQITSRTRLALDWTVPSPPESVPVTDTATEQGTEALLEFDWAGETARHVGTVVHRLLQHIGQVGVDHVVPEDLLRFQHLGRTMLARLGVAEARLDAAVAEIDAALQTTLEDERGRWILSGQHHHASCELAISGLHNGTVEHMVIDRTFVDEQGICWIIDYKTGAHTGGRLEEFLDRELARYHQQLERYARFMQKMQAKPIRLALYFPRFRGWREWEL